jgi:hypothetical protein
MSHHEMYVRSVMSDRLRTAALQRRRHQAASATGGRRRSARRHRRLARWRPRFA